MDDDRFLDDVAERLAGLPHVETVTLGGSRAQGTHGPDSDWDLAVYYRGPFDPQDLRDLGWPGAVPPIGGWGGGIYNGGAWLGIEGRRTDVHYRDLDVVDHEIAEAAAGRVRIEHLLFYLAGIPTYVLVAEVAVNRVLRGTLPEVRYPDALRGSARTAWWDRAAFTFDHAAPRTPRVAGSRRSRGSSHRPRCRPATPCSPRGASGSPTRRRCSPAPGCRASTDRRGTGPGSRCAARGRRGCPAAVRGRGGGGPLTTSGHAAGTTVSGGQGSAACVPAATAPALRRASPTTHRLDPRPGSRDRNR